MADNRYEKNLSEAGGCEPAAQSGPRLDSGGRFEACCPSAELTVQPRIRFLDGPAGSALAARQGQALLRAVAALEMVDEEDL